VEQSRARGQLDGISVVSVSYHPDWHDDGYPPTTAVFQLWVEALNLQPHFPVTARHKHLAGRYPLPEKCDMIVCQR
jgi:hypothetical protein